VKGEDLKLTEGPCNTNQHPELLNHWRPSIA